MLAALHLARFGGSRRFSARSAADPTPLSARHSRSPTRIKQKPAWPCTLAPVSPHRWRRGPGPVGVAAAGGPNVCRTWARAPASLAVAQALTSDNQTSTRPTRSWAGCGTTSRFRHAHLGGDPQAAQPLRRRGPLVGDPIEGPHAHRLPPPTLRLCPGRPNGSVLPSVSPGTLGDVFN